MNNTNITEARKAGHPDSFVGYDKDGHFVHYCRCGRWGSFGYGYFPRQDKLGLWYCREHRPKETDPSRERL